MGCTHSEMDRPKEEQIEEGDGEYQKITGTRLEDLIRRECIAVVKSSYFEQCLKKKVPFADRASIPAEQIYPGPQALELWKKLGYQFLNIFSYGWLSVEHPDPKLFHLRRIVKILREIKVYHRMKEQGVILDFCSMWQKRGGTETRSEEHLNQFHDALSSINTPYGHEDVTAIRLTAVSEDVQRGYDDRGWTLFESIIIRGKGKSRRACWGEFNVLTFDKDFEPEKERLKGRKFMECYTRVGRGAPFKPDAFAEAMNQRKQQADAKGVLLFTNGKDQPMIVEKYKDAYAQQVHTKVLDYCGMALGDSFVKELANFFEDFYQMRELVLAENNVTDAGVAALAKVLPKSTLKNLWLQTNPITDEGATSLAAALKENSSIETLVLVETKISLEKRAELRTVWGDRAGKLAFEWKDL